MKLRAHVSASTAKYRFKTISKWGLSSIYFVLCNRLVQRKKCVNSFDITLGIFIYTVHSLSTTCLPHLTLYLKRSSKLLLYRTVWKQYHTPNVVVSLWLWACVFTIAMLSYYSDIRTRRTSHTSKSIYLCDVAWFRCKCELNKTWLHK